MNRLDFIFIVIMSSCSQYYSAFTCRAYSITAASPSQLCRLYILGILAALWKSNTATKDMTANTKASKFRPAWINFIISLLQLQVHGSLYTIMAERKHHPVSFSKFSLQSMLQSSQNDNMTEISSVKVGSVSPFNLISMCINFSKW